MPELHLILKETILLAVFGLSALVQLLYYFLFYSRSAFYKHRIRKRKAEPVSVIICARDEANNLKTFLPSVLEQDYHDYEVIVVNDCSDDDSEDILKCLSSEYDNLKITTIHKESSLRHSKKMALFLGIKAAKNDLLLLTDADCQPVSANWISQLASTFVKKTDFALGYGGYLQEKGLLNKYIRYDTSFIAIQYTGMAMAGLPYMGVGRNLAYRKSAFMNNKGFGAHLNLQSGDDDLFVNQLANKNNTRVNLATESFTRSVPSSSWKEFIKQKTRHMSTAPRYRGITKLLLIAEPVSRLIFYALTVVLLLNPGLFIFAVIAAPVVILSKLLILGLGQKNLKETDLLVFSLLFDIFSPFLNVFFLSNVAFNRHQYYEWK